MIIRRVIPLIVGVGLFIFAVWYLREREAWEVSPLGLMLGSGLAAGLLTQGFVWWKEHRREREQSGRDRQFIALQLAVSLERYAIECGMRIDKIHRNLEDFYGSGHLSPSFPGLPELKLPATAEWRWIAPDLASEVLSLAPRIAFAEGTVQAILDLVDQHAAQEEAQLQLGSIGNAAWTLAEKLREKHNIPVQAYVLGQWNFIATLEKYAPKA